MASAAAKPRNRGAVLHARVRRASTELFAAHDRDAAQERIKRAARRARVWVALAAVIVVPFLMPMEAIDRILLSSMAVGYLAFAELVEAVARRWPWVPDSFITANAGCAVVFVAMLAMPEGITVGMLAFAVLITFYTCIDGLRVGLPLAIVALGLTALAQANVGATYRDGIAIYALYALFLLALCFIVDAMVRELRRTSDQLSHVRQAMEAVSTTPDFDETLQSIVESITQAVGAATTGILLKEDDHLILVAPREIAEFWTPEQVAEYTRRELQDGDVSPLAWAITHDESVIVPDVADEPRFPRWAEAWSAGMSALGFESIAVVPLRLGGELLGVLNACFTWKGAIDEIQLEVLEAWAQQAALVISRAQAYQQEQLASQRLQEADDLKSDFLTMVSHELRTPLTSVKGWVDTVLLHWDRLDDARRRQLLARASANSDELTRLVDQLLDFSRIEADRIDLRPAVLPLRSTIEAITNDLAPVLAERELIIDVDRIAVVADLNAFKHVLVNLLTNAVKYSQPDTTVAIEAVENDDEVVIAVVDEGIGIEPAEQERIFERFYQASGPVMSRRGTGIGLAIVRRFVEYHGGRVWVESTPGEGSAFSFTLPAAGSEREADHVQSESPEAVAS